MFTFLLGLINPLKVIAQQIAEVQKKKIDAENTEKKLEYDERIKILESRRDSILAAQADPFERWVRIGFAVPFVFFVWKLVVWDKILGWGVTDNLSEDLWTILYIVLGGYFVDTIVRKFKK